jgi:integrase
MTWPSYLHRRRAVYYWRRRVPLTRNDGSDAARWVTLSLRTKELARARFLAAQLNAVAEDIFRSLPMLSQDQQNEIFRAVLLKHSNKLAHIVAAESADADFDRRESLAMDQRWHWAYHLLAARGSKANVDESAAEQMRTDGLSERDIYCVGEQLRMLRDNNMVPVAPAKIESLLGEVKAAPTEVNAAAAQQLYFRAMAEACAISFRRQREGHFDDSARAQAIVLREAQTPSAAATAAPAAAAPASPLPLPPQAPPAAAVAAKPPAEVQPCTFDDHPVWRAAQSLAAHMAQYELRDAGGRDQLLQTCRLFTLLLLERNKYSIEALAQEDFAAYRDLLAQLPKFYGKSGKDKTRSLAELRDIGRAKPKDLRGVKVPTVNKHVTALSVLVDHMRDTGKPLSPTIDPSRLRMPNKGRARYRTQSANPKRLEVMFNLPPYSGCAGAEQPFAQGPEIYHCANYWVPLLLHYHGMRREEACGLRVLEVFADDEIAYLEVVPNAYRGLKNLQSERALPLHPELMRLGISAYRKMIAALGYDLFFPELHWGDATMPVGDRFYKNFSPGLKLIRGADLGSQSEAASGPGRGKVEQPFRFRQMRKAFGAALKRKGIHTEERSDLMGHGGANVNEEVYVDPIELKRALELMEKIPIVTAHLQPQPSRLLPWVQDKLPPPDARRRPRRRC